MPVYWKGPSWNGNVPIPSLGFWFGTFKPPVSLSMLPPLRLDKPWRGQPRWIPVVPLSHMKGNRGSGWFMTLTHPIQSLKPGRLTKWVLLLLSFWTVLCLRQKSLPECLALSIRGVCFSWANLESHGAEVLIYVWVLHFKNSVGNWREWGGAQSQKEPGNCPRDTHSNEDFHVRRKEAVDAADISKCFMDYLVEEELDAPFVTPGAEVGSVSRNYTEADLCSI